jgi:hypothetical protein
MFETGNPSGALKYAKKAEANGVYLGNIYEQAQSLFLQTKCHMAFANYRHAQMLLQGSSSLWMFCGIPKGGHLDMAIMNAEAEIHMCKTEYLESRKFHISMLSNLQPTQQYHAIVANLSIGFIDIAIGVDSKQVYQNLETCRSRIQMLAGYEQAATAPWVDVALADLSLRDGNHTVANTTFSAYVASPGNGSSIIQVLECLERLADLSSGMNNLQNTLRWAAIFISLGLISKTKLATMKAIHCLGQLLAAEGDDESAFSLFTVALEAFTFMDVHRWRADCMVQIADIYEKRGEIQKSVGLWKMARPLFERSSQAKDVTRLGRRLAEADFAISEKHEQQFIQLVELHVPVGDLVQGTFVDVNEDSMDEEHSIVLR